MGNIRNRNLIQLGTFEQYTGDKKTSYLDGVWIEIDVVGKYGEDMIEAIVNTARFYGNILVHVMRDCTGK